MYHGTVRRVLVQAGYPRTEARFNATRGLIPTCLSFLRLWGSFRTSRSATCTRWCASGATMVAPITSAISLHRPRPFSEAYLSASAHSPRRTGTGRLGSFRSSPDRLCPLVADDLCQDPLLVAAHLSALLSRRPNGELPARSHVGAFTAWSGLPRVLLYDKIIYDPFVKGGVRLGQADAEEVAARCPHLFAEGLVTVKVIAQEGHAPGRCGAIRSAPCCNQRPLADLPPRSRRNYALTIGFC